MPGKTFLLLRVILLLVSARLLSAQPQPALDISGPGIAAIKISLQDLSRMPRLTLDVREPHKGEMQHYEGVRLSDLLAKAGVPLGEKLRGQGLATYVVATASDGYAVVYSIAELDPAMTDNQVIVAATMNGKPLEPKEGPLKIVVPGDKRPARWIRMLTDLRIENAVNPSESSPR
jgi:hypothetical protein